VGTEIGVGLLSRTWVVGSYRDKRIDQGGGGLLLEIWVAGSYQEKKLIRVGACSYQGVVGSYQEEV